MSEGPAPFRDAAVAPSALALARLRARPVDPIRRACSAVARYRTTTSASPRAPDIDSAEKLGFSNLGNAAEGFALVYRKRVYVDPPRTTQAQLSNIGYFFITYFESGKCIITWDHVPTTPSNEVLQSRATKGSFTDDYDAHVAAVCAVAVNDAPIVVRDIDDAVALGDFYYRSVVPTSLAVMTLMAVALMFVLAVFVLVWLVSRVLG